MRQRVTTVLVARNGADYLERTLAGLAAQTRTPDAIVAVDAASQDSSEQRLAASAPTQLVALPLKMNATFGAAVAFAVQALPPAEVDNEWLWLLSHDSAPDPRALQHLLAAVEIAPSVAVAGPKVMSWHNPDVIAEFGESLTQFGSAIALVEGELDQAQHDVSEDVLGVAANGMLVRRSLWEALGGFDPGLPTVDAGLDFSIRARLAGSRVVVVPGARVSAAGGPELFGRPAVSATRHARVVRRAQLHRRLVYAPALMVPLHWLSLLPLAVLRSLGQLLAKHPSFIGGEFTAAFAALFDTSVLGARRRLRRGRTLGWAAIAPLRLSAPDVRERRSQAREVAAARPLAEPKVSYLSGGGLWAAVFAGVVGIVAFGPLLGAKAVSGGALLPLSGSVAELWSNVGYGWRTIGTGFLGAADPFATVLATLGSVTFWAPSLAIVALYFVALPLASAAGWFAARRMTRSPWVPLVGAVLWAGAPPFIASLVTGHLGAVIAHILLPWLFMAVMSAARSLSAAAVASLLFAVIVACAPILAPVLVLGLVAWMVVRPKGILRLVGVPVLAAALFAPLVAQQVARGTPLALLADPGAPAAAAATSGWHLALVSATEGLGGWSGLAAGLGLPGVSAHVIVAALLAPVGALALLALFVPASKRAIPALTVALLGFLTAVASAHIAVTVFGTQAVPIWTGSGLSLFWFGLVGGVVVALSAFRRGSPSIALTASLAAVLLVVPLLGSLLFGTAEVRAGLARSVPAVVAAEARTNPQVGTLRLVPAGDGVLIADLQRGTGSTLDSQSTLAATAEVALPERRVLARLAGNLASRGDYDPADDLAELHIGFVVLVDSDEAVGFGLQQTQDAGAVAAVHKRTADALDGNPAVAPVGQTTSGLLWRVVEPPSASLEAMPGNTDTAIGRNILIGQGVLLLVVVLLAVPTQRRRRRVRATPHGEGPAPTFDEDPDD